MSVPPPSLRIGRVCGAGASAMQARPSQPVDLRSFICHASLIHVNIASTNGRDDLIGHAGQTIGEDVHVAEQACQRFFFPDRTVCALKSGGVSISSDAIMAIQVNIPSTSGRGDVPHVGGCEPGLTSILLELLEEWHIGFQRWLAHPARIAREQVF